MIANEIEQEKVKLMKERNEILKQRNALMEQIVTNRGGIPDSRANNDSLRLPEEIEGVEYLLDSDGSSE